jgi:hypothetical protein
MIARSAGDVGRGFEGQRSDFCRMTGDKTYGQLVIAWVPSPLAKNTSSRSQASFGVSVPFNNGRIGLRHGYRHVVSLSAKHLVAKGNKSIGKRPLFRIPEQSEDDRFPEDI